MDNKPTKYSKRLDGLAEQEARDLAIIAEYRAHVRPARIAKKYFISRTRVYQILKECGALTHAQTDAQQAQKDGEQ